MADDLKPGTPIFRCLERLARPDTTADNALMVIRTPLQCEPTFPPAWETEMAFEVASMRIFLLRKNADAGTVETDEISDAELDEAAAD